MEWLDYAATEEQKMMQDVARGLARERLAPAAAEYDATGEFPWPLVEEMAKADLFRVFISDDYDGMAGAAPIANMCLVTEELAWGCAGISLAFAATALGALPIVIAGSEQQKKQYLPRIAAGEALAAFALTEPSAGSDAAGIRTTAVKDGDYYVLNGTKQWISNGGEAEVYTVFVLTDPSKGARGASCIVVEKGTAGFSFGKKEEKMGIRASATRELIFQDCRVPAGNLLGRPGTGFITAMRTFDASRPGVAAQACGIARRAVDEAVVYATQRQQFGRPIGANQGLQFLLADMAMKTEAARALVYAAARYIDSHQQRSTKFSAMAKCFASDAAMEVTTDAVQVFGGYGYMKEYPVEKLMRDAKITQIYEGTNQIQRDEIARTLIKEAARGEG